MTKVKHFLQKITNAYYRNKAVNETIRELSKLSNRELNDIGLSRGDIYHVAQADAVTRFPTPEAPAAEVNANLKGFV